MFSCWTCCWCSWQRAGWGYPGGSSPVPPPSLWLGWWCRPDVIARQVFKYLPGQCTFQQTWNKIQTIMIPLIPPYSTSKPRHKAGSRRHTLHFFSLPEPHSKKASTDLKQCLEAKDSRERHKEKRKSMQKVRTVTPGSRRKLSDDFCLCWQKVSPLAVSSLQLSWHWNAARLSDFKPKYLSKGPYQATSVSSM